MATLKDLSNLVQGELKGDGDIVIDGVSSLEAGGPADIAAVENRPLLRAARASNVGAFLTTPKLAEDLEGAFILHEYPLVALNAIIMEMGYLRDQPTGVHPTAILPGDLAEGVVAGAFVYVAEGAKVGARTVLHAHAVIEAGAEVGEDCILEPGAVLNDGAVLGNRVRIGAHAVISRQGFGFAAGPHGPIRLHHIGRVVIEDDASIGAGTMVDRARFDETRIGAQSHLDNLIHIGHNCIIGKRSFFASQTGLSGRAKVGDDCLIGGQVGFANAAEVGNGSRVGAQSGVMSRWPDKSDIMWSPCAPRRKILRKLARFIRE